MRRILCVVSALSVLASAQTKRGRTSATTHGSRTHGPSRGSLLLQGGVGDSEEIGSAFRTLAGGAGAHIVVIPTASVGDAGPPGMEDFLMRRNKVRFGVGRVTVLHSLDRATSDSESFVEPLGRATGVWILGGFPGHLINSYLGTRTERAIRKVLDRGGVVGGESAGAMIQASWMDATDNDFTPEMSALIQANVRSGFGLLTRSAIFPHFDKRGAEAVLRFSAEHPDEFGIGIDEETALIVTSDVGRVVGRGRVSVYDGRHRPTNPLVFRNGERFDLAAWKRK